ncbi:MAG: 16S rRNA (guanine(527)-N(7))-methyltransferase RsmG [Oscillospiraceae bacterium]|nr:16S rRNA (guanine(527)-N(7))-methyltransferase RsmG [Oscillospiraceae bacterium]
MTGDSTLNKLQQSATAFGLALSARQLEQFETYWTFLSEKNQVMNLTAITDRAEAMEKHFLDSLALAGAADFIGKRRLIDIGTGAGFPGLPLKIAVPSLKLTLLDSLAKRVTFLKEVCQKLDLNAECVHARAEEWVTQPGERESYDYATSRAVADLNILLELCLPYVKIGGAFLAMKTQNAAEEIETAKNTAAILGGEIESHYDYALPGTPEIQRRIVIIRKTGPTPKQYPRRFAKIQKDPLK